MSNDTTSPDEGDDDGDSADGEETAEGAPFETETPEQGNDDSETTTDSDGATVDSAEELTRREQRLDQRELGLDTRAEELAERNERLDERAAELDERESELHGYETKLDAREERIADRETELDERETAIEGEEQRLAERADKLDRKEQTLQEYVGEQVTDIEDAIGKTIQEAVSNGLVHYDSDDSRLGTTGALLVGLAGVALIVAGAANVTAAMTGGNTTLLASESANLAVGALVALVGLGVNLVAVTDHA